MIQIQTWYSSASWSVARRINSVHSFHLVPLIQGWKLVEEMYRSVQNDSEHVPIIVAIWRPDGHLPSAQPRGTNRPQGVTWAKLVPIPCRKQFVMLQRDCSLSCAGVFVGICVTKVLGSSFVLKIVV